MEVEDHRTKQPKAKGLQQVLQSKSMVLLINFGVTGFLGLPLIWCSPAFTRFGKFFWSIIVIVYTFLLIAFTVVLGWWAYAEISKALR